MDSEPRQRHAFFNSLLVVKYKLEYIALRFLNFLEDISLFYGATDAPVFGLLVMACPVFQS